MVIKELEKILKFMESECFIDMEDERTKQYILTHIDELFTKFNISYFERKLLEMLQMKLNQPNKFASNLPTLGTFDTNPQFLCFKAPSIIRKTKDDYIDAVKETIKEIKEKEKQIPNELIETCERVANQAVTQAVQTIENVTDLQKLINEYKNTLKDCDK